MFRIPSIISFLSLLNERYYKFFAKPLRKAAISVSSSHVLSTPITSWTQSLTATILLPFYYPIFRYSRYYDAFTVYYRHRRLYLKLILLSKCANLFTCCKHELLLDDSYTRSDEFHDSLFHEAFEITFTENYLQLLSLFSRKRILVYGPGLINNKNVIFSDYDIICVPNSLDDTIPVNMREKTVIFVNNAFYNRNKHAFELLNGSVKAIVLKIPVPDSSHPHLISCEKLLFNNYGPLALTNMLYTISMANPASISVYGFDAYSTNTAYRSNIKDYSPNIQHYSNNLRLHEPFSNFSFVRALGLSGIVKWDNFNDTVFSHTPKAYARMLDISLQAKPFKPFANSKFGTRFYFPSK